MPRARARRRYGRRRSPSVPGSLEHLADHVPRLPPHLLVDPSDVLPDQPQGEDLEADQEEEDREEREHSRYLGTRQTTFQAEDDRDAEAQDGHEDPGEADELDREQREPRQEIEVQSEQAEETVAGAAMLARAVVDRHLGDRH